MRGGSQRPGKHTFQIGPGGIEVFPRIETLIPAGVAPVTGRIRSGIPGLDELMGGGTKAGDATLVMGPSGVGKTIFGLRWIAQGLEQGEHCLYVTFQDTADQLIEHGRRLRLGPRSSPGHRAARDLPRPDGRPRPGRPRQRRTRGPCRAPGQPRRHRQPGRTGPRRPRMGTFPRLHAQPRRAHPRGRQLIAGHQRNDRRTGLPPSRWTGSCSCSTTSSTCGTSKQESQVGRALNVVKMRNSPHEMTLNQLHHHRAWPRDRRQARRSHRTPRLERAARAGWGNHPFRPLRSPP